MKGFLERAINMTIRSVLNPQFMFIDTRDKGYAQQMFLLLVAVSDLQDFETFYEAVNVFYADAV
jgi:hypothetical protein